MAIDRVFPSVVFSPKSDTHLKPMWDVRKLKVDRKPAARKPLASAMGIAPLFQPDFPAGATEGAGKTIEKLFQSFWLNSTNFFCKIPIHGPIHGVAQTWLQPLS